jgi:SnoaL-like protein
MKNQQTSDSQPASRRRDFLRRSVVSAILAPPAAGIAHTMAAPEPTSSEDEVEIRQLYRDYTARLATEAGRPDSLSEASPAEPAPLRLMHDPAQPGETITVSQDRRSASARFPCMAQMAVPLTGDGSLLAMARLQGQYSQTWWEDGIHELDCVRSDAGWKIRDVVFRKAGRHGL